ncbi:MAG: alpha/beta hydrolase [Aureispira sp.]|nr:alpha/beta hydrolase [Aureispira sp.]
MQPKTIVFIHGLFMNDHSWMEWKTYFEERGYNCIVPQYPLHKGNPADLRTNISADLGKLEYTDIVKHYEDIISQLDHKPILIGHSVGGMLVQSLVNKDLATMGICIDSAPPKGINCFKWSFIKANIATINPFKGNSPFLPSVKWFHYAFCNTLSMEETEKLYNQFVVPESRER